MRRGAEAKIWHKCVICDSAIFFLDREGSSPYSPLPPRASLHDRGKIRLLDITLLGRLCERFSQVLAFTPELQVIQLQLCSIKSDLPCPLKCNVASRSYFWYRRRQKPNEIHGIRNKQKRAGQGFLQQRIKWGWWFVRRGRLSRNKVCDLSHNSSCMSGLTML